MTIENWYPIMYIAEQKEMSFVVAGLLSIVFVVPWKRSIADEVRKFMQKRRYVPRRYQMPLKKSVDPMYVYILSCTEG